VPGFAASIDTADAYLFLVDLRSGLFSLGGPPALRGFPPELTSDLDALARSLDEAGQLKGLGLLGTEWTIPPPADTFLLRYGKGLEEGDPTLVVILDRSARKVISIESQ
jgi:hypothetical protein